MKTVLSVLLVLSGLPAAAQDWAKPRLAKSSRHQEWVQVKNGDRTVHAFVVYPEVKNKAAALVVIHEIFGMTEWVQGMADQFAEAGYIAIAPDLLSGMAPNGGRTSDIAPDKVGEAISKLPLDQITADLNAVADYVTRLPAANGKLAVAYIEQLNAARVFRHPIVTKVSALAAFYPAEAYHQDYVKNHPNEPYIYINDLPKLDNLREQYPELYVGKR